MVEWTDAAIEAAIDAFYEGSDMRAALDAAVKAQGMLDRVSEAIEQGRILGRCEALEEAASICLCRRNEIRALKEKQGDGAD